MTPARQRAIWAIYGKTSFVMNLTVFIFLEAIFQITFHFLLWRKAARVIEAENSTIFAAFVHLAKDYAQVR